MGEQFVFSMTVTIQNKQELFEAAKKQAQNCGLNDVAIRALLGTKDAANLEACLQHVLVCAEPSFGLQIEDSWGEPKWGVR